MNAIFLPDADVEFRKAIAHYEQQRSGLGDEFAAEVRSTVRRIESSPDAWPKSYKNTRTCATKRFPYGVVYYVHGDVIRIVAVAHLHRKPGYWKKRL